MSSTTLIISISVIILLFYVIFSLLRRKTYVGSVANANLTTSVTGIKANSTAAAAYSIWIYVTDWNNMSSNIIFQRGTDITLSLSKNTNKIIVASGSTAINAPFTQYTGYTYPTNQPYYYATNDICQTKCGVGCYGYNFYNVKPSYFTNPNSSYKTTMTTQGCQFIGETGIQNGLINSDDSTSYVKNIDANNYVIDTFIPLQEWVFITINMDTNYIEVYINGKLVQTIVNTNVTHTSTVINLSPGSPPGFNGFTSKFQTFNKTLTSNEIWKMYKSGFGIYPSLSDYSVKVGLIKD